MRCRSSPSSAEQVWCWPCSAATPRPWLARRGETHTAIPIAVRRVFDAGAAHHGLVFFIVAALFCVQTLLGGATAHYHADTGGFFGYDLASVLPYNLARTWHLQLGLFWVVAAFLAAGSISRR